MPQGVIVFERMRQWFDALQSKGPKYGYFPKPSKCILVVKPERFSKGQEIFKGTGVSLQTDGTKDTGVEINTTGTRHLGAAVGTSDFKTGYVNKKIDSWISALKKLSMVANSQPTQLLQRLRNVCKDSGHSYAVQCLTFLLCFFA